MNRSLLRMLLKNCAASVDEGSQESQYKRMLLQNGTACEILDYQEPSV